MEKTKQDVDSLFSKADDLNLDEVETKFKAIMKEGEKAIDLSGNLFF